MCVCVRVTILIFKLYLHFDLNYTLAMFCDCILQVCDAIQPGLLIMFSNNENALSIMFPGKRIFSRITFVASQIHL